MRQRSAIVLCVMALACGRDPATPPPAGPPAPAGETFTESAAAAGLDAVHFNGMSGEMYLAEIMAPGVALFDYDRDGDLDLYVVQGQMLGEGKTLRDATFAPPPGTVLRDRLYRNDLQVGADGARAVRFTDVTDASRIDSRGYGMGVAAGDIDNDGWVDLFVTRLGSNLMLRNKGDGTFEDVSKRSGVTGTQWSVSASFVDYDRDGWLDLYVGNYLVYEVRSDTDCFARSGAPDYCAPAQYRPATHRLFRNRGNGTFADVTAASGVASAAGPALGVVAFDANRDGWPDIFVANDAMPNLLWINQRDGTFQEMGLIAGVALSGEGRPEGSMGVDAADVDNDGDEDIIVTNLSGEGHALYVNDGSGVFEDQSTPFGLTALTLPMTGFGAAYLDYDNDGWLDLLTVNGAIHTIESQVKSGDRYPLHQRKQLLHNDRDGRFSDASAAAGASFGLSEVGRGAAFGDVDNDGDTDVVVANNSGPLRLLLNNVGSRKHWVGLMLAGTRLRDMVGARVEVRRRDGSTLVRRARADGSYASANDPRVIVGLGDDAGPVNVRVTWPGGAAEEWRDVPADRYTTLREGTR
jgi:enediyne biosynthesis protein E4